MNENLNIPQRSNTLKQWFSKGVAPGTAVSGSSQNLSECRFDVVDPSCLSQQDTIPHPDPQPPLTPILMHTLHN